MRFAVLAIVFAFSSLAAYATGAIAQRNQAEASRACLDSSDHAACSTAMLPR
jgi:hypothetical protein